ncbi:Sugar phosphate permease [Desulfuromusa kysingii]|uniref:Sugar phosphate permease n=2 Tax=Desulfuromusa kysingii TaxID=37625 RepID=A0A1H4AZ88_9BACT|nr:Sugar phosphate permease [Desulfuromusa kysingii]
MLNQAGSKQFLLRLFLPFGLGYFVSYLFRTVNAVIAPDLVADLGLNAADLGLLTSAYFFTFAAFQLPLGVLLDRFGPRRVEAGLLMIAAIGALVFSQAETLTGVILGRALIGLGVSACLMAAFKAFASWLPNERLPLANGVQMMSGGLGALTATTPVQAALQITDWRGVFGGLAGIALLAAIVVFIVVPDEMQNKKHETFAEQLQGLHSVLTDRHFWQIAPWAFTAQAAYLSIQGLWTGPWLRDVAGLGRDEAAQILWWIAIAMIAGYFTLGRLAEQLAKRGIRPVIVAAVGMSLFILVQLLLVVVPQYGLALWLGFGFLGTACILPYAVLSQFFPPQLTGRCNTSLNLLVFVGAFSAQWLIGGIISLWPTNGSGGYSPSGYQAAFLFLIACQIAAAVWYWLAGKWIKDRDR